MATGGVPPTGVGAPPPVAPKPAPTPQAPPAPTSQASAPVATTELSADSSKVRTEIAYERWNKSIENGVTNADPDARAAARGTLQTSLQQTEAQAAAAKEQGKPYDMDAGLAANMANNSAQTLLGGEKSPDPNAQSTKTLTDMHTTSLSYLKAREAELIAQNGGQGNQPGGAPN